MIFEKVKKLIAETTGCDEEDITMESTSDDLGFDSLDRIGVVMALEEEFDIEIYDSEGANFNTVADVVKCIEQNV